MPVCFGFGVRGFLTKREGGMSLPGIEKGMILKWQEK